MFYKQNLGICLLILLCVFCNPSYADNSVISYHSSHITSSSVGPISTITIDPSNPNNPVRLQYFSSTYNIPKEKFPELLSNIIDRKTAITFNNNVAIFKISSESDLKTIEKNIYSQLPQGGKFSFDNICTFNAPCGGEISVGNNSNNGNETIYTKSMTYGKLISNAQGIFLDLNSNYKSVNNTKHMVETINYPEVKLNIEDKYFVVIFRYDTKAEYSGMISIIKMSKLKSTPKSL